VNEKHLILLVSSWRCTASADEDVTCMVVVYNEEEITFLDSVVFLLKDPNFSRLEILAQPVISPFSRIGFKNIHVMEANHLPS